MTKARPARCAECKAGRPCPFAPPCPPRAGPWTFSPAPDEPAPDKEDRPRSRKEFISDVERRLQSDIDERQARVRK